MFFCQFRTRKQPLVSSSTQKYDFMEKHARIDEIMCEYYEKT